MRRLDTLECERAAEELRLAVERGEMTLEQAQPGVQFFLRQGMTEEAQAAFDESCKRLIAGGMLLMIEVQRAQYLEEVPFGNEPEEEDEEPWLPFNEEDR